MINFKDAFGGRKSDSSQYCSFQLRWHIFVYSCSQKGCNGEKKQGPTKNCENDFEDKAKHKQALNSSLLVGLFQSKAL